MTHSCKISKEEVYRAYKQVKANRGAEGVDGQTIKDFENNLRNNLYKIWNRMSSGSYFPPAVKQVEIPKADGKKRKLGIPTVSDRIAQTVIKNRIEPGLDKHFHPDSYGYRPNKDAHQALEKTRKRCWQLNWVIDMDIKGFFDNISHSLLMKAVNKHVKEKWIRMYIQRWLEAPVSSQGEVGEPRSLGTPQGGVISPLLANLFLHYAFDKWMSKNYPQVPFERYADDVVVHCNCEREAQEVLEAIDRRMQECKLMLHTEKTKIVTWKKELREKAKEIYPGTFDFLSYQFKQRTVKYKGRIFVDINPAISPKAKRRINQEIKSWKIPRRTGTTLEQIAESVNPIIRGWLEYYGAFGQSRMRVINYYLDKQIVGWIRQKHSSNKARMGVHKTWSKVEELKRNQPGLFEHWKREMAG